MRTALETDDLQLQFARELHDEVAQPLISLLLQVRELKGAVGDNAQVAGDVASLEDSVRTVLKRTREMITDRRQSERRRHEFLQALEHEVSVPPGRHLRIQVSPGWPREVDGWIGVNLLRIVQQAVANAWRHGQARTVDVVAALGASGDAVVVVLDDGSGIEDATGGWGMAGMRERAVIVGGTFSHQARRNGGTRVEVRIPLEKLR